MTPATVKRKGNNRIIPGWRAKKVAAMKSRKKKGKSKKERERSKRKSKRKGGKKKHRTKVEAMATGAQTPERGTTMPAEHQRPSTETQENHGRLLEGSTIPAGHQHPSMRAQEETRGYQ